MVPRPYDPLPLSFSKRFGSYEAVAALNDVEFSGYCPSVVDDFTGRQNYVFSHCKPNLLKVICQYGFYSCFIRSESLPAKVKIDTEV